MGGQSTQHTTHTTNNDNQTKLTAVVIPQYIIMMNSDESTAAENQSSPAIESSETDQSGKADCGTEEQPSTPADEVPQLRDTGADAAAEASGNFCIVDSDDEEKQPYKDEDIAEVAVSGENELKQSVTEEFVAPLSSRTRGSHGSQEECATVTSQVNKATPQMQDAKMPPRLVTKQNSPKSSPRTSHRERESTDLYPQSSRTEQDNTESDWNPFSDESLFREDTADSNTAQPTLERSSSLTSDLTTLRQIFDTEYERAIEHQEISWKAKYAATRISFLISCGCMVLYLWLGCMFYRSEAGWSVPDALLFTGMRLVHNAAFFTFCLPC